MSGTVASPASRRTAELNQRAARELIGNLVRGGARHAVISPGSRSTPLVLALHHLERAGRVQLHTVLDERSAAFFALGLARASAAPAILISTSGTAGAHYLPAMIEAAQSGVPLLAVTADRPGELQGVGAAQTVPQTRFFDPHVRASIELVAPAEGVPLATFSSAAARALVAACSAPRGPVHLNVPFREPLWIDGADPGEPTPERVVTVHTATRRLDAEARATLAVELGGVERGAFVVGPQDEPALIRPLVTLARRLGWPILADAASQLRFGPHDRSALVTRYDAILRAERAAQRLAPDLIVRLGRTPCSRPLLEWLDRFAADRVIAVEPAGGLCDPTHLARMIVAADAVPLLQDLAAELGAGEAPSRPWLAEWLEAERIAGEIHSRGTPSLWEGAIARRLSQVLPDGAAVHLGNGMPIRDFDAFAPPRAALLRTFVSRGANGIDGTVSTATGEAIARGGPLVLVAGDLTTLHDLSGLRLAADLDAPLVIIAVDNGGGGIFDFLPIAAHRTAYQRHFLTPQAADLEAIAAALGLTAVEADSEEALAIALERALSRGGPSLIRVPVDRETNVAVHRQCWADTAAALDGWAESTSRRRQERREEWALRG
ncbi:MAG: 2-succinyl-5-enolpyruvyl-6-hydroxy-3-cyclohexene-1-carboxylic-acid synthase [Deltaproteobacteria bacterium]|nr:2-succinyl-5-enolpyruvyl-6-hydroxy-3-cyclohexene-1-carboxylic-acid synthase [Deltaproteobacteria bacterium]